MPLFSRLLSCVRGSSASGLHGPASQGLPPIDAFGLLDTKHYSLALQRLVHALKQDRTAWAMAGGILELALLADDEWEAAEADVKACHGTTDCAELECALRAVIDLRAVHPYMSGLHSVTERMAVFMTAEHLALLLLNRGAPASDPANRALIESVFGPLEHMLQPVDPREDVGITCPTTEKWHAVVERSGPAPRLENDVQGALHRLGFLTHGLLDGVLATREQLGARGGIVAAGGAALAAVTGAPFDDVDLFFVGYATPEQASEAMYGAVERIMFNAEDRFGAAGYEARMSTSNGAVVTLSVHRQGWPPIKVQFIKRLYQHVAHVPLSFDISVCRVVLLANQVLCTATALNGIRSGNIVVNPLMTTKMGRYIKYARVKKFSVWVPLFDGLSGIVAAVHRSNAPRHLKTFLRRDNLAALLARACLRQRDSADYSHLAPCAPVPMPAGPATLAQKRRADMPDAVKLMLGPQCWTVKDPAQRMYAVHGSDFLTTCHES